MNDILSLSHAVWDCKYHLVWIPKYRKKAIYGDIRRYLGEVLRELALQKESKILEGHLRGDHIHMLVSIPPKYAVSQIAGYIKGKSAIHVARTTVIIGRTSQGRISEPGGILSRPLAQTRLRSDPTSPDKKKTIVGYPDLAPFFPSIGSKSAQKTSSKACNTLGSSSPENRRQKSLTSRSRPSHRYKSFPGYVISCIRIRDDL